MRLGKRSTRGRSGNGRQLIGPVVQRPYAGLALFGLGAACVLSLPAQARTTSVGPGRIVCNASFCELGSGAKPKERVRVIISELPRDEIERLRKCTGVSKPCIVKIDGAEQDSPTQIIALTVYWQD